MRNTAADMEWDPLYSSTWSAISSRLKLSIPGISSLQGRHRDMEVFPDYVYNQGSEGALLPMYDDKAKKWSFSTGEGRKLDRTKFEEWKTRFYAFEGFNTASGWPTRKTLESMGLKKAADVMQSKSRLG
jgi:aldehyde:ferredoxin oxidoreductase